MASTTRVKELAAQIYIDMVSRLALAPGVPDKPKPTPEAIAKLCFKLAEAFMKVDEDSEENAAPSAAKFEVNVTDWDK
jgi:hypothetical protein